MAVPGSIKQVPYDDGDDDDDGPTIFKRPNSASRQSQLNSGSKKPASQKRINSLGKLASDEGTPNYGNSNFQKNKMTCTVKAPSEKSKSIIAGSNSRTSFPDQSKHFAEQKLTSNNNETTHLDNFGADAENSDDSDDDKPLSHRLNAVSMAVQKNNSVHMEKVANHSSEHKLATSCKGKMNLDKPCGKIEDSDDSDDDKTLSSKFSSSVVAEKNSFSQAKRALESPRPTSLSSQKLKEIAKEDSDDSEDDKPLLSRFQTKSTGGASTKLSDSVGKPLASKFKPNGSIKKETSNELSPKGANKRPLGDTNKFIYSSIKKAKVSDSSRPIKIKQEVVKKETNTDDYDHIPIAQRIKKSGSSDNKSSTNKVMKKITSSSFKKDGKKMKKAMKDSKFSKSLKVPPGSGGGQKWTTLEHNGVIFPPAYQPHGVKMLYNGQPVDLTPEQEEVATMFAVMKDTDYATKPKFIENFWNDWKQILGKSHVIKKFDLCDFTPIYEWHLREKEKKKQMSAEEKKALKEEKLKQEEKYMWAIVDGVKEKVGNFRVEPPGLFRGRGEHPKMGKLKKRIRPSDITINIGKGAPIPECPIPGERWKEVKHENTVTWLAFWNDPINPKEFKYVFLAASSTLKGQSDKEKYEKARLLKDYIHNIRANYTRDFTSKDATKRQIAVATYLIDKLALRAGNEKDDDEADTVGCCTLKVENVVLIPPNKLQFDFLGKDSIRYFNTVEVELPVYKAIGEFRTARKSDGDDLFDLLDTSKLNAHLKELMPGLTAKVFRTYNASITLDDILNKETKEGTLPEKIAVYQHANKEVAIICNHQRSVSKSHDAQMSRLNEKIMDLKTQREELKVDLSRARKGKPPLKDREGKTKRNLSSEALEKKIAQIDSKIEKMELDKKIKEDLKTVALGTSKINYLDPRITVAWCKRHEVPIEKIFNKSLLAKFTWAMDVDPSFRF
ncbi:DNA topoisomerase 1 beta isoform X1 [Elaeis guineensis]|uniref:DNA topoisomerase I n=2 Tax=Elaeis guineensis var. tenera TaxID=51953 RepID=A0A6J0PGN8_ELAGV|nr:DNA topoisomerase 1 alpha isoform X1 [Elaeis guineensis]XP_019704056.1 DNA topoisomerase 1 alpha isoform X1 [Elaeis guineensis]XP_029118660.1 DNA topoisomerase 1 alpha isoform X1 [Elaeis guineensis]